MGYVIGILLVMVGMYLFISGVGTNLTIAIPTVLGAVIFLHTYAWDD